MSDSPQIHKRMVAVMADIGAIYKGQWNDFHGFNFRGIDDVYNSLHPLMAKHGIFTTPKILSRNSEARKMSTGKTQFFIALEVEYTFWAEDGSSVACSVSGEASDSADKATPKALAAAHKYALLQTFLVPTRDMPDQDAGSHSDTPAGNTSETVIFLLTSTSSDNEKFFIWMRKTWPEIGSVDTFTQEQIDAAVKMLNKKNQRIKK